MKRDREREKEQAYRHTHTHTHNTHTTHTHTPGWTEYVTTLNKINPVFFISKAH